jgi:hypothetical protein
MKFLVILKVKDTYFNLPVEEQFKLIEDSFSFVDKHLKSGMCKDIYHIPGSKGTAMIWEADSAEQLSLRFLENPMSIYEDPEIIVLSSWDEFKSVIRRIYNKRLAK